MAKKNYYAVASGKRTGIFDSWDEARPLVERVRGALHKGFATRDEMPLSPSSSASNNLV